MPATFEEIAAPDMDIVDDAQLVDDSAPQDDLQATDPEATKQDDQQQQAPEPAVDERQMPKWLKEMKARNDPNFRDAKSSWFAARDLNDKLKDFPIDDLKPWLTEKGGREGLETALTDLQQKADTLTGYERAIASGDRSVVDVIAQASGENFPGFASAALSKWMEKDPESYSAALSGAIAQTFESQQIPMQMEKMGFYRDALQTALSQVPEAASNPNVVTAFTRLMEQLDGFATFTKSFAAKAAAPAQTKPDSRVADGWRELENAKVEQFRGDVTRSRDEFRSSEVARELKSFTDKNPDAETRDMATTAILRDLDDRMKADAAYLKSLDALGMNKEAALKLIKSREAAAIKEIAPRWGRKMFGQAPAPVRAAVKPDVQQRQQRAETSNVPVRKADKFAAIWADA